MTGDLRERLRRLGEVGAEGVELARPDIAAAPRRRRLPVVVAAGAALATVVGAVALLGRDDGGQVRTGPPAATGTGPAPARIAVVPEPDGPLPSRIDFIFHLLDRDGDPVLAREAHLDVPEDIVDPDDTARGRVETVPAGDLTAETTFGAGKECRATVTVPAAGEIIVRVASTPPTAGTPCVRVQSVQQWIDAVLPTSPSGRLYVGLRTAEAEALAVQQGHTSRVVGVDGTGAAVRADLQPGRLDFLVFDGRVVSAYLPADDL